MTQSTPPSAPTDWKSVAPADMTLEQLQAASTALVAGQTATQQQLEWQAAAVNSVKSEIRTRFDIDIPGLPLPTNLNAYPAEQVNDFAWS